MILACSFLFFVASLSGFGIRVMVDSFRNVLYNNFVFFCPGSNPGSNFVFSCHVSLVPLICTVPKAYFFFHDTDILQS